MTNQQPQPSTKKNAVCNTCTIRLINLAYQRASWFRMVREPLRMGMQIFAFFYRVNPEEYDVRSPSCYRCLRFYKTALKEKSALFRFLNNQINPLFDSMIDRLLTSEEIQEAKEFAKKQQA